MYKQFRYGRAILGAALFCVAGTANASFGHCYPVKSGATGMNAAACDVSFTTLPSFANLCLAATELGIYTIRNNTPVSVRINYIRIQNNDALPAAASAIVAAPTNSCVVGTYLAAGASCNIGVTLSPLALGAYNRVLQVGVDTRQVELDSPAITALVNCTPAGGGGAPATPTVPGTPLSLYSAAILGTTTATNTGISAIVGDVDVSPGTAQTGFTPAMVTGTINLNNGTAIAAQANAQTYYSGLVSTYAACIGSGPPPAGRNLTGIDLGVLGAVVLTPGVYCFSSSAFLTGALVLNGALGQSYTFITGSTLITSTGSTVTLTGGLVKGNVNWAVGSSATLGSGSLFQGIIDATVSITLGTGTSLQGWAWTQNGTGTGGAVTLAGTDTVNTG